MTSPTTNSLEIPRFDRSAFLSGRTITRIGAGEIGGKAHGLVRVWKMIEDLLQSTRFGAMVVDIPRFVVIGTEVFDRFMRRNDLYETALSGAPDDRIAHAFQRADLPVEIVGDLKALMDSVHAPLAVRSSSRLEDALYRPFAGVYETKMTPNNQPDSAERFRKVAEAIKFVYAGTFFKAARSYLRVVDEDARNEKMAIIVQEVVGQRRGDRFYPTVSGVARSYNYYPTNRMRPEEGVVNLALGLGKTIVDGGVTWSYCPRRPTLPPPFGSARELMKNSQTKFWAVNMGRPPAFDPIRETEYLQQLDLDDAEYDNTLTHVASTYVAASDRIAPGVGSAGPRVINFAPLLDLKTYPFNEVVRCVLEACQETLGEAVEVEFAATLPAHGDDPPRFGVLQVRPMVVPTEQVEIDDGAWDDPSTIVASTNVMGNGKRGSILDVVYVKPDAFDPKHTPRIARDLEAFNGRLLTEGRPYLLIGFGRWGSSDPWLGIPVQWGQICGVGAIVEASLPNMNVEPSQGSHFFHNLSSFQVCYFTVPPSASGGIRWQWLDEQASVQENDFIRHVRLAEPLQVLVDGRSGRGVIQHHVAD